MSEGLGIFTDRKIYSVPDGLSELMHDVCKEVIRCQPKNVYKCISDYLTTLLKVREAVKVAVPIVERDFEQIESEMEFLRKYNLSPEEAARFATIIQAAYRGYRTRKSLFNIADQFDQVNGRGSKDEEGEEKIDYSDPIFELLRTRGMTLEQTHAAATKIQAYFRGHRLRKLETNKGLECILQEIPSHESWRHDWLEERITKKSSSQEFSPLRKSLIDFQKNYMRKNDEERLHMETIFAGNYEKYNMICEEEPCQQVTVPTKTEIIDLVRPGDIESSVSDELEIPGAEIMRELMNEKIRKKQILSEEQMITSFELTPFGEDLSAEDHHEGNGHQRLGKSIKLSQAEIRSKSMKGSITPDKSGAPELSVRSLSKDVDLSGTARSSKKSLGSARSQQSITSKKSVEGSVKSERLSKVKTSKESLQGSIKPADSKLSTIIELRSQKSSESVQRKSYQSEEVKSKTSGEMLPKQLVVSSSRQSIEMDPKGSKVFKTSSIKSLGEEIEETQQSAEVQSKTSGEVLPKQSVVSTKRQSTEMERKGSNAPRTSSIRSLGKEMEQNVEENVIKSKTSGLNMEGPVSRESVKSAPSKSLMVEVTEENHEDPQPEGFEA